MDAMHRVNPENSAPTKFMVLKVVFPLILGWKNETLVVGARNFQYILVNDYAGVFHINMTLFVKIIFTYTIILLCVFHIVPIVCTIYFPYVFIVGNMFP